MEQVEPRLIADSMLGKLARWLRIMGYDVEYFPEIDDDELVERAESSGRLILTRDTLLVLRRKARSNHLFISGDSFRDQLRQVVEALRLDPFPRFLTRCLECNEPLAEIENNAVRALVPPYVFMTQERFRTCPLCRRIYWSGTQRERMAEELRSILFIPRTAG